MAVLKSTQIRFVGITYHIHYRSIPTLVGPMDFHFKKCHFPFQIFINLDSLEFFTDFPFQNQISSNAQFIKQKYKNVIL